MSKDPRVKVLIHAGKILAGGPRWQGPLSRATGVAQQHISMLASGDRNLTPDLEKRIAKGLIATGRRMVGRGERIMRIGERFLSKRGE